MNYIAWFRMEDLMAVASKEGKPQWGGRDPPNAGCYNSFPSGVPFFEEGHDSFLSDYGRFFLVCSRIISSLATLIQYPHYYDLE